MDADGNTVISCSYEMSIVNKSTSRNVRIKKTDSSETPVPLKDAEFTLVINNTIYTLESNDEGYLVFTGKIVGDTAVELEDGDPTGRLETLQTGEYSLVETNPPAGYIMTNGRVVISVGSDVTAQTAAVKKYDADDKEISASDTETEPSYYVVFIENEPGRALPNTGGPGTLPYTLGGLMLVIASALICCIRMRREERG